MSLTKGNRRKRKTEPEAQQFNQLLNTGKTSSTTHGSHGLSDVNEWRRILTHVGQQSVANSKTLTKTAKNLLPKKLNQN